MGATKVRITFALIFAALLVMSIVVWTLQPRLDRPGEVRLVRVSDDNPVRQEQIKLFNQLHPGTRVEIDPGSQGVEKVIVQSLGGVGPDIFDCFSANELSAYVQSQIAWDITDELEARGIDLERDCFPGVLPTGVYQGRVYGVPTNVAADGIWFHRDLLRSIGVQPHRGPWTWSELIPLAQKLTLRDKLGKPIRYGFYFDWGNWSHFFAGFGAATFTDGGARCVVDDPKAIAAVQLMYDLVYRYRVSSNPVEEASMATTGGFGSGDISLLGAKRAAMALGGRWWLAELRGFRDIDLGVMESPYGTVRRFHAYCRFAIINSQSPHKREALTHLLYMAGPEYNDLINQQADGICAFRRYADSETFKFNPAYPKETDNEVWREITKNAVADDTSPFVNGNVVARIMQEQLDLVKADQKSPAAAMKTAAEQINAEMQRALENDPVLKDRWLKVSGSMP